MKDLLIRLRDDYDDPTRSLAREAADEIERLQDEWNRMNLNLQAKVRYCEALEKRYSELSAIRLAPEPP